MLMKTGSASKKPAAGRSPGKTERAPEQLRRSILKSALKLFEIHGYHATSVDDIVKDAGFTKGALYHHFPGKEDILLELQRSYIDNRVESAQAVLERHKGAQERLRHLILEGLIAIGKFRAHVAVFSQERRFLSQKRFAEVKRRRDELEQIYVSVIGQGIKEGIFSASVQPRIASFAILGMLTGAYGWYRPNGPLSADEVADQLCRLVIDGLAKGKKSAG